MKLTLLFVVVLAVSVYPKQLKKANIKFKISGRGLPDKDRLAGTTDGYVKVSVSDNLGTTELGKTFTVSNSENPDWTNVFQFNFDRSKNQRLNFIVMDENEYTRDSLVGEGSITTVDFVDKSKSQTVKVLLDTKGYLKLQETSRSV